ncbi:MAG: hypothetical protein JWP36_976 [Paucimonas sp.]|nr:hypothetical protein [Paucimonas sp.]
MECNERYGGSFKGRRMLLTLPLLLAAAHSPQARAQSRRETINIRDYGVPSNGDWSAFLNAAASQARQVYFPAGEYVIRDGSWPQDTELFGEGERTVLRMAQGARWLLASGSPAAGATVANLVMHDLQLRGNCDSEGFAEHVHLLRLAGVSDVRIENVVFRGFRGDGLYLGAASAGVHNRRVLVRACVFDGINHANRQGISVIDGETLRIEDNSFERCTRNNMPGAIDFEPNDGRSIIRDVSVKRNRFNDVGGNVGVIAFHLQPDMETPPEDITVVGNRSRAYRGTGAFLHFGPNRPVGTDMPASRLLVQDNDAAQGALSLHLGGRQVLVSNNRFTDFKGTAHLGYPGTGDALDFVLRDNVFLRCGSVSGNGLTIFRAQNLLVERNQFIDCGSGKSGAANAIDFNRGKSSHVILRNNEFSSPTGKTEVAVQKEVAHVFSPGTNAFEGNQLRGLRSWFPSS